MSSIHFVHHKNKSIRLILNMFKSMPEIKNDCHLVSEAGSSIDLHLLISKFVLIHFSNAKIHCGKTSHLRLEVLNSVPIIEILSWTMSNSCCYQEQRQCAHQYENEHSPVWRMGPIVNPIPEYLYTNNKYCHNKHEVKKNNYNE